MRQQGTLNSGNTGISGTPSGEEDFTYDPAGNWSEYVTKTSGNTTTLSQTRTHNLDNEITALAGLSTLVGYDRVGNMTTTPQPANAAAAYTLTWDAWNRLVKVHSGSTVVATYVYDGLTRRIHAWDKWLGAGRTSTTPTNGRCSKSRRGWRPLV